MLGTINSLKSVVVDGNPMKSIRRDIIMVRDKNALLIGGPAKRERSGLVVECLTRDPVAAGSSLTGVTALCP